jgi:osmotically-inducible protein OsmY
MSLYCTGRALHILHGHRAFGSAQGTRMMITGRPDVEIQRHVEAELFSSPGVDDTDIAVRVSNGRVTLSGRVPRLPDKYAAEEAAKRVPGVSGVDNHLRVNGRRYAS